MATRRVLNAIATLVAVATLAACGSDDSPDSAGAATTTTARPEATTTTTTTAPIEPLRILLVNDDGIINPAIDRSAEHTSELQSLMRISYAVFCLKHKTNPITNLIYVYLDTKQPFNYHIY